MRTEFTEQFNEATGMKFRGVFAEINKDFDTDLTYFKISFRTFTEGRSVMFYAVENERGVQLITRAGG